MRNVRQCKPFCDKIHYSPKFRLFQLGGNENMHSQIFGLRVASAIFGLMSLAQLMRLLLRPEVIVDGYLMPLWPNALALVFFGILCIWLWKLSCMKGA